MGMGLNLQKAIGREEFDYLALMSALGDYANPRDKVTSLLRQGVIVRVKKGLYVFGDDHRKRPYSRELLGNLVYGPSFVSLDTALSHHGLIPERVAAITSVTTKRCRRFDTPVGRFVYRQVPAGGFHLGIDRMASGDVAFLIAVPTRALADKVRDDRGHALASAETMEEYIAEELRIDRTEVARMDRGLLTALARAARSRKIAVLAELVRRLGRIR